jgi:uncharacterized membrane protein YeiH
VIGVELDPDLVVTQLIPTWVDVTAITIGALAGSIAARRWGADILGMLIIAIVSGLGGGIIRDVLLNRVPAALSNEVLIPSALVAAAIGFLFADLAARAVGALDRLLLLADAAFLGTYAVIGAEKAMALGLPAASCVFVGVLSGVGGGLLRDVLFGEEPSILRPGSWNALAALVGTTIYVVLVRNADLGPLLGPVCIGLIAVMRLASVTFGWSTPVPRDLITESETVQRLAKRQWFRGPSASPSPGDAGLR